MNFLIKRMRKSLLLRTMSVKEMGVVNIAFKRMQKAGLLALCRAQTISA